MLTIYTGIRLGLFALSLAIAFAFGLRSILLVAVALVASGVLSYPLARRQRDQLIAAYEQRRAASAARMREDRRRRGLP